MVAAAGPSAAATSTFDSFGWSERSYQLAVFTPLGVHPSVTPRSPPREVRPPLAIRRSPAKPRHYGALDEPKSRGLDNKNAASKTASRRGERKSRPYSLASCKYGTASKFARGRTLCSFRRHQPKFYDYRHRAYQEVRP